MTTRYIELDNKELKELVITKGEVVDKGRKHYKEIEKLTEIGTEIGEERNDVVSKIIELTAKELGNKEVGEFEVAMTTDIHNGVLRVAIVDQLAQFKENTRLQKNKAERREKGELTPEEILEGKQQKLMNKIKLLEEDQISGTLDKLLAVFK
jgi:hypothetical protein